MHLRLKKRSKLCVPLDKKGTFVKKQMCRDYILQRFRDIFRPLLGSNSALVLKEEENLMTDRYW
jgi:hypothetical protein